MRLLINNIKSYLKLLINKIDFSDIEFESETETIVTLYIRFYGKKIFIKDFKNSSEWYEYNSYKLYSGSDIKKIKTLSDYPGGEDYKYTLDICVGAIIESPAVKSLWLSNLRDKKIDQII